MSKLLSLIALLVVAATSAPAAVLWDQSDVDAVNQIGAWDAVSGCAPFGGTIHVASDIHIYDQVTVTTIRTWYTAFNFDTESAIEAYLWIAPKTGALPVDGTDLPQENGTIVPITVTLAENGLYEIAADGLSVMLDPGDYWVSLTPFLPGGIWGPDFHVRALTNVGDPSTWYEYCGQFAPAWGANFDGFDMSIQIEGTINAVPNGSDSMGNLKARF